VTNSQKKSDLGPRLVTAAIGVPVLLALALISPNWSVWLFFAVAAAIGTQEWASMCLGGRLGAAGWSAVAGTFAILSAAYWGPPLSLYATASLTVVTTTILAVWIGDIGGAARRVTSLLSGMTYVTVLFGGMLLITAAPSAPTEVAPGQGGWMLFPMLVIFAGDTGAYFTGRAFGRHKLAPVLSPKKTWEGAFGGAIASVGGGFLCQALLLPDLAAWQVIVLALPAAVLGQVGDLCESAMKRATGVKDSGRILYGHGGILDRVDGLIFAAPYIAVMKVTLGF
jgi:phosphatidate cytidylyltransferase